LQAPVPIIETFNKSYTASFQALMQYFHWLRLVSLVKTSVA